MRNFEPIRRPLRRKGHLGVAMTALALVHGAPALAQEATTAAESVEAAPGDQIIVTGSRVARDGFQAPTPLVVLTQQDIQNTSPSNNIADFVNQMPQLAGSTKPANSRLNISNGSAGINALNMRNLGENRVLVLIDGRRSVGSTIFGWVDINTIPQALVDRVEVVTGGASSAYGSDAVTGVVNFVLNKKMEGLRITGDIGLTDKGDGFNYSGSIAGGMSFADNRGHFVFNAELAHQDGIYEVDPNDRPWNHRGYLAFQNPAYVAGNGLPQFITFRENAGQTNQAPGGFITGSVGNNNALRGLYFGVNGQVNQFNYGSFNSPALGGSAAVTRTVGGDWRVNDSGRRIGLAPKDDRWGAYGRLSYEVADGVEIFAEGSYNKQEVFFNAGPNLGSATLDTTGCTTIPVPTTCNAFALQTLGAARLAGVTSVSITTTAADLPFRGINNKREVQRYVVGAEGEFDAFGKAARWDVYGQYGRSDLREQLRNIMHVTRMRNATDAAFAPAGNAGGYAAGSIQCLINVDASTTNNDPNCVPLNRLGLGVASSAAIDYVLGDPYRKQTLEQFVTGANLSLTPFATWAGDVSIAIGGEYRKEKIRGSVPTEFQPTINPNGTTTNAWSVGNYLPFKGSYNVKEAYLETVVPLGLGLEFNGAVRATDYSTSGYVTTWKLGATWAPIEDIRFRVTRSRDIRAPNLNELFQAGTANSDSVRNPAFTPDLANGPQFFPYSGLTTGNPDLKPEKADSWNIGAVVTPRFLPGFSASVDYFRIDLEDAIDTITAQEIVNRCDEGRQEYCDAITEDPARAQPGPPRVPYLLIRSQPFNFVSKLVRGIDFDAAYRLPVGGESSITLRGTATRYIENLSDTGIAGVTPVNTVGANGGQASTPKWIFRTSLNYETPTFSGTVVGRGVSSGKYLANAIECTTGCPTSTSQFPTYDNNHVKGTFYVDLNLTQKVSVKSGSEAEFFFNVTNLFDADPLLLPETGLAANSTFSDLLGRTFRVGVRFKMK
ncbi:TonB-dependent receptor plug domain-containing protein [Sphingopyxis sp. MSC1_008]|jgi:iron complex outermembrane receptor protein|uniref:TonB-dependent receptor plug domain-containing protein n=1 Tax=Sphingopyxis sp. MSC1_008 TaxID=2909265 RepID=UPI0020C05F68|nr:TonB-dependent receptor [Sphingopyxis sp. MSC1_008]